MTYESFLSRLPAAKKTQKGAIVRCPSHDDSTASLSVGRAKDGGVVLKCFAGCEVAAIVLALGLELKDLFAGEPARKFEPRYRERAGGAARGPAGAGGAGQAEKPVIEKVYSYTDAVGRELFQAVRLKPKSFRQRHGVPGAWVWNMEGIERVLYRLPAVLKAETVWICEGEKDVDGLISLPGGRTATCNVGGAGKWLDGYTEALKGKSVVLCGDNDEAGRKHMELVFDSVSATAASVRVVKLPGQFKDVSDMIVAIGAEKAGAMLDELAAAAVPHVGGVRMPVYSMAEIEEPYRRMVNESQLTRVDLGDWLPSFKGRLRPLTPGTLVLIIGSTAVGKTLLLQNIAMSAHQVKTLMFELELSAEDLFERFMANQFKIEAKQVEKEYLGEWNFGHGELTRIFPNLFICPEPRMSITQMEAIILKAELKMGGKPLLVLLDYVQLMQGEGKTRYEKASNIAEALKVLAKATKTIVIVASQVDRTSSKEGDIGLHSAKDSGSLESSAGVVLSAKRDKKDPTLLMIRVLKATKGGGGLEIECNIDGAKSLITERSKVAED